MGFRDKKKNKVNIQIEHKKPDELANQLAINSPGAVVELEMTKDSFS